MPALQEKRVDLNLKRVQIALKEMGEPCKRIPAIQIAGTNGKGSIASFLKASLQYLGINAGIATSPHLVSWCERICTTQDVISEDELKSILIKLQPFIKKNHLTPFESLIAASLDYFNSKKVDLIVLEVGLGGRLDATTAHPYRPIIAMAGIGLDHCEYLGNSLTAITKEKASIIGENSIVISAQQHPEVEEVLRDEVAKKNASLHFVPPLSTKWILGLPGEIQTHNAAVAKRALEALKHFGWTIDESKVKEGFANASWPGRFQRVTWNNFSIFIDCAHNPHAANQLSKEREGWEGHELGVNWILGIQTHKDAPKIISSLLKQNDLAWITPIPGALSWKREEISAISPNHLKQMIEVESVEDALSMIFGKEHDHHTPITVITGSIYLIGDLIERQVINFSKN